MKRWYKWRHFFNLSSGSLVFARRNSLCTKWLEYSSEIIIAWFLLLILDTYRWFGRNKNYLDLNSHNHQLFPSGWPLINYCVRSISKSMSIRNQFLRNDSKRSEYQKQIKLCSTLPSNDCIDIQIQSENS